jgi:hypothetical protein
MRKILLLCLFLLSFSVNAQESPEVISAENISRLQSAAHIDFAEGFYLPSPAPNYNPEEHPLIPNIQTGWFSMDATGRRFALVDEERLLLVSDMNYVIGWYKSFESYYPAESVTQLVDVVLNQSYPFGVYLTDGHFRVFYGGTDISVSGKEIIYISNDMPQSIWLDCDDTQSLGGSNCYPWLEMLDSNNQSYVIRMPNLLTLESILFDNYYIVRPNVLEFSDTIRLAYAPAQDPEAVVRIGRIPPPYTVTSSLEGIVKLWNLQTGAVLYEVDNGTGQPSVFGAINNPPTHLVWRDNANESLYLLNFETGENRLIAELNGDYAQWFFLNPDASVILAVDLGFQQNVVAWNVATGEKIDLGHYRECTRPQPDMARLSADGTTLVIGCDTGLDIWRIDT